MTSETAHSLGHYANALSSDSRCAGCHELLPFSAAVEVYETHLSRWIVAKCPKCHHATPFRLDKGVA